MYCTKCGRENEEGVKFCSHCGAMMEAPSLQSGPPDVPEQPEVFAQPETAEQPEVFAQPETAEQPEASVQPETSEQTEASVQPETSEQSETPEQPKAPEQPWMTSQPNVVEQSWMGGQTVGAATVQMPNVAQINVPPVQMPQVAQTNLSPVQMGQMPPTQGQAPMQSGQMPPMAGSMQGGQMPQVGQPPVQNGQMPIQGQTPMQGGQISQMGQMPMQGGQMPPMGQMPMQGGQVPPMNGQRPSMPYSAVPPANPTQKKGNGAVKAIVGIIIALLVVGVGAVAFLFINKNSQEKKLQNQLEVAADYMADGSYEEAVAAYLEILEKNPESSEAIDGLTDTYIKWAERYAKDENYEEAISILQGADDHAKSKTIKKKISEYEEVLAAREYEEELAAMNQQGFTDADLVFRQGSHELTVELNHALIVRSSGSYYTAYADASYDYDESGEYETNKGLKLGDSLEDYLKLYEVEQGYSAWELYSGDNNEYTSFAAYEGQLPSDMYTSYNNVWLDIGFSKENGEWRALTDMEIKETWFCDAPLYDYEEVVILAVNFDRWGEVIGLSLEHFSYDESWVEWQNWDDGSSSFDYTGNKEEFTDEDLYFTNGTDWVEISLNHSFIVYSNGSQILSYADADYATSDDLYVTYRGLEIGMQLEDYRELYSVEPGYAVWELFRGENNEYTSFAEYTGQSPADMYDGTYNNAWLDIGFCKENGEWRAMYDYEVRDTWFCDADLDDYEEVVVFAVNLDQWGEVRGLSLEHFSYDDGWVEWQGWAN